MKKPDHNKIDQLFRNGLTGAEGKPANFREEDWDAMEALLDKKEDKKRGIIWLYWVSGSIAALLLLFFGLNWYNDTSTKPNHPLVQVHQPKVKPDVKTEQPADQLNPAATEGLTYTSSAKSAHTAQHRSYKGLIADSAFREDGLAVSAGTAYLPVNSILGTEPLSVTGLTRIKEHQPFTTLVNPVNVVKSSVITVNAPDDLAWLAAAHDEPTPKLRGRALLTAALLTAPDVNKAGPGGGSKLGGNAGLQVSAHISSRWSITTGAIYAYKPYRIGANQSSLLSQYFASANVAGIAAAPAAGTTAVTHAGNQLAVRTLAVARPATLSATAPVNPLTGVMANCTVLDIPVNVNYQVSGNAKRSFSAGAGLSSYFMLTEHYSFNYADNSVRELDIANKNQHVLGVLNLNTTYQQQVSPNLKLLIQPYLKLPITQIGQEQVNLQSAGVAVGFSWNLSSAKPK